MKNEQIMQAAMVIDPLNGATGTDFLEEGEIDLGTRKAHELPDIEKLLEGLSYYHEPNQGCINLFCSTFPVEASSKLFNSLEELRLFVADYRGLWIYEILKRVPIENFPDLWKLRFYTITDRNPDLEDINLKEIFQHFAICFDSYGLNTHKRINSLMKIVADQVSDKELKQNMQKKIKEEFFDDINRNLLETRSYYER